MITPDASWLIAYVGGFGIILLFSWERLNHRVIDADQAAIYGRRERLLELLKPAKMRHPRIFVRGYLFYTLLLLVIYTVFSLFTTIAGLFVPSAVAAPGGDTTIGIDGPEWPLAAALVMTGLAPSVPVLARIEERFRALAHGLVGVPQSFHRFTDALIDVELERARQGYDLLDANNARQMRAVLDRAEAVFGKGFEFDDFANATMKLFAFRAWTTGAASWPSGTVRRQFDVVEAVVVPETAAAIDDLKDLAAAPPAPEGADADGSVLLTRWRVAARKVADSVEDVCALFALYAEQERNLPLKQNPISDLLRDLIRQAQERRQGARSRADVILIALVSVALAAGAIGFVGGWLGISTQSEDETPADTAYNYLLGVILLYGPTSVLAWNARAGATRGAYVNPFTAPGVFPMAQFVRLFVRGFLWSLAAMTVFQLFSMSIAHLARIAQADTPMTPSVACIAVQYFGVELSANTDPECQPTGLFRVALAYAPLGAWNAVCLALVGDLVQAGADRGSRLVRQVALHGGGLALWTLVAAELLDRLTPDEKAEATVVPEYLNAAQELVAFEMITAALLAATFSLITRAALRRLRDGPADPDAAHAQPA